MNPEFAFTLHQRVRIKQLETIGVVLAFYVNADGVQYSVRYFYSGDPKTVYFFADELEAAK